MSASLPLERHREAVAAARTASLGMWIFLGSELLFFGGLLMAYLYARTHWPQGFGQASARTHVVLGTLNTGLLLTSSALVALAVACQGPTGRGRWVPWLLGAGAALGTAFLAIKGWEYRSEWREGLFPGPGFALKAVAGAELFFVLYFLLTGLHSVHLLVGVALLVAFGRGTRKKRAWAAPRRVEAAALYWHFVDVVWIFLYPLLYLVNRHG